MNVHMRMLGYFQSIQLSSSHKIIMLTLKNKLFIFGIILDLEKHYKDSTESFHIPFPKV